jgi:hypothetical protein
MACINNAMLNEFDTLVVNMPNAAAAVIYSANRAGGHLTDYSSTPILVTVSFKWLLHRTRLELNYGCFALARIIRRRSRLSADHTASRS